MQFLISLNEIILYKLKMHLKLQLLIMVNQQALEINKAKNMLKGVSLAY